MRIAVASVVLLAGLDAHGAELHVGPGQPYATVQAAVTAAAPGDRVLVHAGTFAEDVSATTVASEAQRIVLEPAGDGDVLIEGMVTLDGDYWDVSGLTFRARPGARGFRVRGNFNRLLSIELSGGDSNGVDGGGVGNEVAGSHIYDFDAGASDAHCIVLNPGAERWIIRDNDIHDCSGDTIQLYASRATRLIKDTRIEGNRLYFTGALTRTENAIDVKDADGLVIFGNEMYGFPDNKIVVFQKAPIDIDMQCNALYGGFTGVEFRGEDGGTVENVVFARNLIHDQADYALKFDGVVNASVYNNTFVDIDGDGLRIELAGLTGGAVRNNLWLRTGNVDGGSFDADHNGFFSVSNVGIASPTDVLADPLLDAAYGLMTGSPAIDAGVDVGMPFSGAAPDLGAYELGLAGCDDAGGGSGSGGGSASGGSSGTGGTSAGGGSGSAAGGGSGGGGPNAEDGEGCDCRNARPAATSGAGLWLAALLLAAARGRRGSFPWLQSANRDRH